MWVRSLPLALRTPNALLGGPFTPRLPLALRTPNALLGAYDRSCNCHDNTMGAMSGQATGAIGGATTGAKIGSVVPGIGTAIGAAVGAIAGAIFGGHADHAQIQRDVDARKALAQQYLAVAGTIPGRQIGLARLRDIWKGLAHYGHFPKWAGQEQRIDYAIDGCSRCDPNTMNRLIARARAEHSNQPAPAPAPAAAPVARVGIQPTPAVARALASAPAYRRFLGLQGLGDVAPLDAKTFIDQYFIPANVAMGDHWAVPIDPIGQQVLYDVADAYLTNVDPNTPVYVASQPAPAPAPAPAPPPAQSGPVEVAPPPTSLPTQPTTAPTPVPPVVPTQPASAAVTTVVPVPATSAGTPDISALVRQLMAQGQSAPQAYNSALSSLQAAGIPPTAAVEQATAQAVQTAGTTGQGLPGWLLVLLAGGAVMFALARPERSRTRAPQ